MPKTTTLPITQTVAFGTANWTNSDPANTAKTVLTAGPNDTVVKCIQAMSTETANARVLDVLINDGSADQWLGAINVPVNSGFNGTVTAVDLLNPQILPGLPYDANGKRVLPLKANHSVKVRNQSQLASGKEITVIAIAEDY